jgi:cell division GTPase FtsZ
MTWFKRKKSRCSDEHIKEMERKADNIIIYVMNKTASLRKELSEIEKQIAKANELTLPIVKESVERFEAMTRLKVLQADLRMFEGETR